MVNVTFPEPGDYFLCYKPYPTAYYSLQRLVAVRGVLQCVVPAIPFGSSHFSLVGKGA